MDRAAGWFKGFRNTSGRVRPKVGEAVRQWASEILEQRVLMSANPTATASSVLGVSQAIFIKNQGQWSDPSVKYAYQTSAANILMTDRGPVFQVFHPEENGVVKTDQFVVSFDDANTSSPRGIGLSAAKFNFMVGDKSHWRSGVAGYNKIAYDDIYNGVDLYTWGLRNNLKYEFHVAPGADYSQVKVSLDGIKGLSIDKAGNLHIKTASGELVDDAPIVYQTINGKRVLVKAQFKLVDNNTYTFQVNGNYDHSRELVLDPTVSWNAYLGGTAAEVANGVALDSDNNIYVTGSTTSTDFPFLGFTGTTGGTVVSPSLGDNTDVFVAKFDPFGVLQWGTYLGGAAGADVGQELAVDSVGHLYVVGQTASADFPVLGVPNTAFTFDTYNGGTDAFLVSLNAAGGLTQFQWGGYIGGTGQDTASSIELDSDGNIFIAGQTASTAFPTVLAFQGTREGNSDGFVMKFDPAARTPVWSTYFGGNNVDSINDIMLDSSGDLVVVGTTQSTASLATLGVFGETNNGNADAWVAKITGVGGGPSIAWATYFGGNGAEAGNGIAVRKNGASDIWITGTTAANSTEFPADNLPITGRKGNTDAFVASIKSDGTSFLTSRLIDTSTADVGNSISIDPSGNVVVVGNTNGAAGNNYVSLDPFNALTPFGFFPNGGTNDGFIYYLNATTNSSSFLTYFGSSGSDQLNAVVADPSGGIITVGTTTSSDLPLGTPAIGVNFTYNGNDAFIMRIDPTEATRLPVAPTKLDASALSMTSIRLTWVPSSTTNATYEVRRGLSPTNLVSVVTGLAAGTSSYVDFGLDPDTTYYYKVFAVNPAVPSGAGSRVDSAKTFTAEMAPPSGLTAKVVSAKRIDLKWNDNSSNDTGFEVWRQDLVLGNFDRIATVGAGVTTYRDQDPTLAPSTQYSYQIRAINAFTQSNFSDPALATTPSANFIAAPSGLVVTALTNPAGNLLTWQDNSDNEDHFSIERAEAGTTNYVVIGTTASLSNAHTFVDSAIVAGHFYTYRVRGVNGADTSAYSNLGTSDLSRALAAPTNLDAVAISNSSIQLVWVNNAIIQTGFIIQRAVNKPSDWVTIRTTGSAATSFKDTKLITNKRYYYRIVATDGTNNSAFSNTATDVTFPVTTLTAPAAPSKLKTTSVGANSVVLNWRDNSIDETSFKVERAISADGPFAIVGTVGVNVKTFTDTKKVKAGFTYFYRVRSWNGQFKSLASNVIQVTTAAPSKHHKTVASISATPASVSAGTFSTKRVTAGNGLMQTLDLL